MPLYRNNKAKYYSMGEDVFEDIFRDILEAKKFILINFFIVAEGALWDMLHEVLLKKVEEGVEVVKREVNGETYYFVMNHTDKVKNFNNIELKAYESKIMKN